MISTSYLLEKFDMLSVNQLNAQIKLLEIWKSMNVDKYPLVIKLQSTEHGRVETRADSQNRPCEIGKTCLTQKTAISDAVKLWNSAPFAITQAKSLSLAKKAIEHMPNNLKGNFR